MLSKHPAAGEALHAVGPAASGPPSGPDRQRSCGEQRSAQPGPARAEGAALRSQREARTPEVLHASCQVPGEQGARRHSHGHPAEALRRCSALKALGPTATGHNWLHTPRG